MNTSAGTSVIAPRGRSSPAPRGRFGLGARHALAAALLLLGANACAHPPAVPAWILGSDEPTLSAEWFLATGAIDADPTACQTAFDLVRGEVECAGSLCIHGVRLAADWLEACGGAADERELVELTAARLEAAATSPTDCDEPAARLLRSGCGRAATCADEAQRWATACSRQVGSPLAVRLLDATLAAESGGSASPLDVRSCDELGAELARAAACDGAACAAAVDAAHVYAERCASGGATPLELALALVWIAESTGGATAPISLAAPESVTSPTFPIALADASGVVLSACGVRVRTRDELEATLATCELPRVSVARVAGGATNRMQLRTAVIPVEDRWRTLRRHPWLAAPGIAPPASDARLRDALGRLGDAPPGERALLLAEALSDAAVRAVPIAAQRDALRAWSAVVADVLADLGRRRAAAWPGDARGSAVTLWARRAYRLPLAEVLSDEGAEEVIDLPTLAPWWAGDGAPLGVYRERLGRTWGRRQTERLADAEEDVLRQASTRTLGECAVAERAVDDAAESVERCLFLRDECTPAQHEAAERAWSAAYEQVLRVRVRAARALAEASDDEGLARLLDDAAACRDLARRAREVAESAGPR